MPLINPPPQYNVDSSLDTLEGLLAVVKDPKKAGATLADLRAASKEFRDAEAASKAAAAEASIKAEEAKKLIAESTQKKAEADQAMASLNVERTAHGAAVADHQNRVAEFEKRSRGDLTKIAVDRTEVDRQLEQAKLANSEAQANKEATARARADAQAAAEKAKKVLAALE